MFLGKPERLEPGESAILTIHVKLPNDMKGYSKITLNFKFQLAVPSHADNAGRAIKTYFGDTLVGIINIIDA